MRAAYPPSGEGTDYYERWACCAKHDDELLARSMASDEREFVARIENFKKLSPVEAPSWSRLRTSRSHWRSVQKSAESSGSQGARIKRAASNGALCHDTYAAVQTRMRPRPHERETPCVLTKRPIPCATQSPALVQLGAVVKPRSSSGRFQKKTGHKDMDCGDDDKDLPQHAVVEDIDSDSAKTKSSQV